MSKLNLLLIDDEQDILNILLALFQDDAGKVFTADNGQTALDIIQKNDIHCIVCDIAMPGMSGMEVIKKIRESGNEVPIIFYTAYGDQDYMLEAGKYGAYDFVNKPDISVLEDVVKSALKTGIKTLYKNQTINFTDDSVTEYKKLLKQMQKE